MWSVAILQIFLIFFTLLSPSPFAEYLFLSVLVFLLFSFFLFLPLLLHFLHQLNSFVAPSVLIPHFSHISIHHLPKIELFRLFFFRDGLHLIHHHQMAFRLERKKRLTQSISNTHTHLCIHLSINTLTTSNWRERKTYWKYADNRSVVWVKRLPQWCHWCVLSTAHMGKR